MTIAILFDKYLFSSGTIREKDRELAVVRQSQQQVNNCLFNGHPQTSGHSSPTNQLIDTSNSPTTNSLSVFYPSSTNMTPSPPPPTLPLQNAASNLDPNAQDFCLPTHSTTNGN